MINVIFIHSETSRIAQTRMTHLFKESETRQCEGNERKQRTWSLTSRVTSNAFIFY